MVIGGRAAFFRWRRASYGADGANQVGDGSGIAEERRVVAVEAVRRPRPRRHRLLRRDRDRVVAVADHVGRGHVAPRDRRHRLHEGGDGVRAQARGGRVGDLRWARVVEDLLRAGHGQRARVGVGDLPVRRRAAGDGGERFALVEHEGGQIDQVAHPLGARGRLGDDDAAVGVPDDDRVAAGRVDGVADEARVVVHVPAAGDAREVDRDDRRAVGAQPRGDLVPAPGAVPGAVDEHEGGAGGHRAHPTFGGSAASIEGMAGHSKWAGIKHKKAIVDARRGKLFTKLARAITVAAKEGGGDPEGNPALGLAVQKAKDASMPKDNIERAIAKGTGEGADAEALEAVLYEGYGPGGVALLVEATTDNRNRTGADMRHLFTKARRQPRRAGLGRLPVRQARRDRRRRGALRRGRPAARPSRPARSTSPSTTTSSRSSPSRAISPPSARRSSRPASSSSPPSSPSIPKTRVPIDEDVATQAHAAHRRARGQRRRRRRARQFRRRRGGARTCGRVTRAS